MRNLSVIGRPKRVINNRLGGRVKVIIITQNDPYYLSKYLDNTLRKLEGSDVVVKKVYALPVSLPGRNGFHSLRYCLSYFGLPILCYLAMLRFGYLLHDLANGAFRLSDRFHSLAMVCQRYGVPMVRPRQINAPAVLEELRAIGPDIILSLASPQIFGRELLALPPKGCLNIHSSLLPLYRGINANFWALAKGEAVTGVTIHYMTSQIDAGEILLQEKIPIGEKWSLHELYLKVIDCGSSLIATCLKSVCTETLPTSMNQIAGGSYFSFPTREDVKEFRARGRTFYKFW